MSDPYEETIGQALDNILEMNDLAHHNITKWIDEIRKDIQRLAKRIYAVENK